MNNKERPCTCVKAGRMDKVRYTHQADNFSQTLSLPGARVTKIIEVQHLQGLKKLRANRLDL